MVQQNAWSAVMIDKTEKNCIFRNFDYQLEPSHCAKSQNLGIWILANSEKKAFEPPSKWQFQAGEGGNKGEQVNKPRAEELELIRI